MLLASGEVVMPPIPFMTKEVQWNAIHLTRPPQKTTSPGKSQSFKKKSFLLPFLAVCPLSVLWVQEHMKRYNGN